MRWPAPNRFLLAALVMFALQLVELGWLHGLAPLENKLADTLIRWHAAGTQPDSGIVIVDIDERSLALLADSAGRWPWPRSVHADVLQAIEQQRPRAVVFDILFSDPDLARPEDDRYFAEVIRGTSNTYFPMLRLAGDGSKGIPLAQFGAALGIKASVYAAADARVSMVLPLPAMLQTGRLGLHNALPDGDGVVRRYWLYEDVRGWRIPSLPVRLAEGLGFAIPSGSDMTLNWHGQALSFPRVSYADIYLDGQRRHPLRPHNEFTNKIIIIGSTATGLHDVRATPLDGFYPGVEILATAIDNLKNGNPLRPLPWIYSSLLSVLLVGGLYAAFQRYRHPLRIGGALLVLTMLLLVAAYGALVLRTLLPVLAPLLFAWAYYVVVSLMEYLNERRAREKAIQTFGRFLDPRVVNSLIERGETMQSLSGKSREVTVLFSDIRGFTTLSEASTPEQVVELLNEYFTTQSQAIFELEGTLDKYIGDAIMAFWGAPSEQPDHALRAVDAALSMSERLEAFRETAGEIGRTLEIGIGIHSGPAVVGFIGSASRQDYTAIGDTVNLASRIEGQTKGVARVLVSEETKMLCEQQAGSASPYIFVDCGSCQVKGRMQPVRLFEPRRTS